MALIEIDGLPFLKLVLIFHGELLNSQISTILGLKNRINDFVGEYFVDWSTPAKF